MSLSERVKNILLVSQTGMGGYCKRNNHNRGFMDRNYIVILWPCRYLSPPLSVCSLLV